jgi:hypothetical protein
VVHVRVPALYPAPEASVGGSVIVFPEKYHCVNCHHAWDGHAGKQTCAACGSIQVEWVTHPLWRSE